jgi:hypothetical protein
MNIGEGELGGTDVDAPVRGAGGRVGGDRPDMGNTVLGPDPGGKDKDKKCCAGSCCQ